MEAVATRLDLLCCSCDQNLHSADCPTVDRLAGSCDNLPPRKGDAKRYCTLITNDTTKDPSNNDDNEV